MYLSPKVGDIVAWHSDPGLLLEVLCLYQLDAWVREIHPSNPKPYTASREFLREHHPVHHDET